MLCRTTVSGESMRLWDDVPETDLKVKSSRVLEEKCERVSHHFLSNKHQVFIYSSHYGVCRRWSCNGREALSRSRILTTSQEQQPNEAESFRSRMAIVDLDQCLRQKYSVDIIDFVPHFGQLWR